MMIALLLEKAGRERSLVMGIYYDTSVINTQAPNILMVQESALPEHIEKFGKTFVTYANHKTGEVWGEYIDRELTDKEKLTVIEKDYAQLQKRQLLLEKAVDDMIFGGGF